MLYKKFWKIKVWVCLIIFIVENGITYYLFYQEDTLSRKEISQEGFETSAGTQFSSKFNLNETSFTELPSRRKDSKKDVTPSKTEKYDWALLQREGQRRASSWWDSVFSGWGFVNC